MDRAYWQDPPDADVGYSGDDGVQFTLSEEGLEVSVTDEQAVDSYNASFTCDWNMSIDRAKALRDWLNEALPK